MTALEVVTKTCTRCQEEKPASAFYANKSWCRDCYSEYSRERKAKFIEEHGATAWREKRHEAVVRYRDKNRGRLTSDKLSRQAYDAATCALRDAHRDHFDALLRQERYDRGLDV